MALYKCCTLLCLILFIDILQSETILRSTTLTPLVTTSNGAIIQTHHQEVTIFNNTWNVNILAQNRWQFILFLDSSWGFYPDIYSSIKITIDSPTITTASSPTDWLAIGITTDNTEYISSLISMKNTKQNQIYPPCDISSNPTQTHGTGDIASIINVDRSCDIANGSCSNWSPVLPKNLPNNTNSFPMTFQLDNNPQTDSLHISFSTKTYTNEFEQQCGFISSPTNRGLKVYIGGDGTGQSFQVKSIELSASIKVITNEPSMNPTKTPTKVPTVPPVFSPTESPSNIPSIAPTFTPTTHKPTNVPTGSPTALPSLTPTHIPSNIPTSPPTFLPTVYPTVAPSDASLSPTTTSTSPSNAPSFVPTVQPSTAPTTSPVTLIPTSNPTMTPTMEPTITPTSNPTITPTMEPTITPTLNPTIIPTMEPTEPPSDAPSFIPSVSPTSIPSADPSSAPSVFPTMLPTDPATPYPTSTKPTNDPSFSINTALHPTTERPSIKPTEEATTAITTTMEEEDGVTSLEPTTDGTSIIIQATEQTKLILERAVVKASSLRDNLHIIMICGGCLLFVVMLRIGHCHYKQRTTQTKKSVPSPKVTQLKFERISSSPVIESYLIRVHFGDKQFDYTLHQKRCDADEYEYDWDASTYYEFTEAICNAFNLHFINFKLCQLEENIEEDINDIDDIIIAFDCAISNDAPQHFIDVYIQLIQEETPKKHLKTISENDLSFVPINSRSTTMFTDTGSVNYDRVIRNCQKIIRTTQSSREKFKAYQRLGFVEERKGNFQKAMKYYRRALNEEYDEDLEERVLELLDIPGVILPQVTAYDYDPSKTFSQTVIGIGPTPPTTTSELRKISSTFEIYT